MLLQPLEEFDISPLVVKLGNLYIVDIQRISKEYELSLLLIVPVYDAMDLVRVLFSGQVTVHTAESV